jgi:hypothetical protein
MLHWKDEPGNAAPEQRYGISRRLLIMGQTLAFSVKAAKALPKVLKN